MRHVVANSHDAWIRLVKTCHIPPSKISVIHNALVFPASDSIIPNQALRKEHGAKPNTLVALSVAMFRPEKNQRELIEIFSAINPRFDWQLWLAGEGPELDSCRQLAKRFKVGHRVKFFGLVRDPSPLYRAADLGVLTSLSESLSNFLIEAQAYGLAVVAYDAQGVREAMLPGTTGWPIPLGDKKQFTQWIERSLQGPSPLGKIRGIAPFAREFARESFDPARQADAYLELFEKLIG